MFCPLKFVNIVLPHQLILLNKVPFTVILFELFNTICRMSSYSVPIVGNAYSTTFSMAVTLLTM